MGVPGLLKWIKKKYPQAIRKTGPAFNNYDMLFVDIPQYVQSTFQLTKNNMYQQYFILQPNHTQILAF